MKPASEILIAAKALIDTPDKWTTGVYARRSDNTPSTPGADDAAKFDPVGAVKRALYNEVERPEILFEGKVLGYLARAIVTLTDMHGFKTMSDTIIEFNDKAQHDAVMQAFDMAAEAAKKDEQ